MWPVPGSTQGQYPRGPWAATVDRAGSACVNMKAGGERKGASDQVDSGGVKVNSHLLCGFLPGLGSLNGLTFPDLFSSFQLPSRHTRGAQKTAGGICMAGAQLPAFQEVPWRWLFWELGPRAQCIRWSVCIICAS